jgi:hypothetical protein
MDGLKTIYLNPARPPHPPLLNDRVGPQALQRLFSGQHPARGLHQRDQELSHFGKQGHMITLLRQPDRKRALNSFTVIEHGRNGSFQVASYSRHYKDDLTEAAAPSEICAPLSCLTAKLRSL